MRNPQYLTESDFGLDKNDMPEFSEDLVRDVEFWLECTLTDEEKQRLEELCRK